MNRARDAVLLLSLACACDSGAFASHPDGSPVKLAFTAQPAAAFTGAAIGLVAVTVQDADGNAVPSAKSTSITVAIGTNPAGGILSGTTTVTAVGGVAVFWDLVIDKVGAGYTLTAEANGLTGATTRPFDVSRPPSRLAFTSQPYGYTLATQPFPVQVSILDELGFLATSSTASVTVAIATGPGGATLSGTRTVAAVQGVATFPDLSIDIVGSGYTLAASASSLISATSAPFVVVIPSSIPGCLNFSAPVPFGLQTIGPSSATRTLTLTNTCTGVAEDLSGGAVLNSFNWQDFSLKSNCPALLGPSASCTFDVTFKPTGPGDRLVYLFVNGGLPNGVEVTLNGTAIGALSMAVAPDPSGGSGGFAYVANADANSVSMYRIDRTTGVLAHMVPPTIAAGTNPASVAVEPSGKFVYVANAGSGDVSTYSIGADGTLASIGPPVAAGTLPVSVAVAPDPTGGPGRFAYVANLHSNDVSTYSIDPATGALTPLPGTTAVGTPPLVVAVHPSGKFAYVGSRAGPGAPDNSTVYAYTVDGTGVLTPIGVTIIGYNVPSSLAVDPSGRFVALTNQGTSEMILWSIDLTTGALSITGDSVLAGQTATSLALSVRPSGGLVAYVTYGSGFFASQPGSHDNSVLTYGIDTATGTPNLAGAVAAGVSPTSIAIDPSGRFAYVANSGSGDITMYGVNTDGTLTALVPSTIGI